METADVLIIGGGIVGTTIAFHLAKAGAGKVVLCERGALCSGTSAFSGAMCGQQAELTGTISRLAVQALRIYERFSEDVGSECGLFNHGILGLTRDLATARRAADAARANGAQAEALTAREAQGVYPELDPGDMEAAVFYPRSGCVDAYRTVHAYAAAAHRHGADLREFTGVTGISVARGRVQTVDTVAGAIAPGRVVLACGPWSRRVAASAGLNLPIEPTQVGVAFFRQPPAFSARPPVLSAELAIIPWHNGHFRVLCDRRTPLVRIAPDPVEAVCPQWMVEQMSSVLRHLLPAMRRGRFQGALQTCYDDTPDLRPLLGFVPGLENLFLDCGWSGRGFKFSVALGAANAKWILNGNVGLDLDPWLASRFDLRGEPASSATGTPETRGRVASPPSPGSVL